MMAEQGTYEIERRLVTGGMSELYLANQLLHGGGQRQVVVKRLLPDLARDEDVARLFLDEARVASHLEHPNIIQVHEVGTAEGDYFMTMEYLRGRRLAEVQADARAQGVYPPLEVVAHVVISLCRGLHHAHCACDSEGRPMGVVHRMLTPRSVMLTLGGQVKLLDLGLARTRPGARERKGMKLRGTYAYISPEQCRGGGRDLRSDIFSIGVLLYELCCHRRLFRRHNELATLRAILEDPIPPPGEVSDEVPPGLESVIMRAMDREPAGRFQSALELEQALAGAVLELGWQAGPAETAAFMARIYPGGELPREPVRRRGPPPDLSPAADPLEQLGRLEQIQIKSGQAAEELDEELWSDPRLKRPRQLDARRAFDDTDELEAAGEDLDLELEIDLDEDPGQDQLTLSGGVEIPEIDPSGGAGGEQPWWEQEPEEQDTLVQEPAFGEIKNVSALASTSSEVLTFEPADGAVEPAEGQQGAGDSGADGISVDSRLDEVSAPLPLSVARDPAHQHRISTAPVAPRRALTEVRLQREVRSRRMLVVGLLAGLLVAGTGLGLWLGRGGAPGGVVRITSEPSGASIVLDGKNTHARTPQVLEGVSPGQDHTLLVVLEGHEPWRQQFRLQEQDQEQIITVRLTPLDAATRRRGVLWVGSGEVLARVFLEGSLKGTTPLELKQVPCGKALQLVLRAEGYEDHSLTLDAFSAGERRKVEASLRPVASGLKKGVRGQRGGQRSAEDEQPVEIPRARPSRSSAGRRKVGETLPPR